MLKCIVIFRIEIPGCTNSRVHSQRVKLKMAMLVRARSSMCAFALVSFSEISLPFSQQVRFVPVCLFCLFGFGFWEI